MSSPPAYPQQQTAPTTADMPMPAPPSQAYPADTKNPYYFGGQQPVYPPPQEPQQGTGLSHGANGSLLNNSNPNGGVSSRLNSRGACLILIILFTVVSAFDVIGDGYTLSDPNSLVQTRFIMSLILDIVMVVASIGGYLAFYKAFKIGMYAYVITIAAVVAVSVVNVVLVGISPLPQELLDELAAARARAAAPNPDIRASDIPSDDEIRNRSIAYMCVGVVIRTFYVFILRKFAVSMSAKADAPTELNKFNPDPAAPAQGAAPASNPV